MRLPLEFNLLFHLTSLPHHHPPASAKLPFAPRIRLRIPMEQYILHSLPPSLTNSTADLAPSPLLATGSFSGFRSTVQELGHGYLTAVRHGQPLCGNAEGWGPLSNERYDFTPCFMDVWVSSVAVYGILFGAVAVWWLARRKTRAVVERDWCFWCKHVGFALVLLPF